MTDDEARMFLALTQERDRLLLQSAEAKTCLQDLQDLLQEQPKESSRPFIIGARERLRALLERWTEQWVTVPCVSGGCRGRRRGGVGSPATVLKGHEAGAMCNECFSR